MPDIALDGSSGGARMSTATVSPSGVCVFLFCGGVGGVVYIQYCLRKSGHVDGATCPLSKTTKMQANPQQHALQWLMIREQARLHVPVDNRSLWLPFAGGGVGGVVLVLKPPAIKTPEMRAQLLAYPEDMLQLDCRGGLLTDEPV